VNQNLPENTPTKPESAQQTLLVPGCLFFIETIEVPAELTMAEIPDFAELSLESIAPFPIERLNWGYLYREHTPTLLIYAAHRDRLKKEGYTDLTDYTWVLPDFATLADAHFTEDTLIALKGDNSVSLLHFEKIADIPKSVSVSTIGGNEVSDIIQKLRSNTPNLPTTATILHLDQPTVTLDENDLPTFEHTVSDAYKDHNYAGIWQTLAPTESQLWQSDVRSADFKTTAHGKRRTSALAVRTFSWAMILMLLLIIVEGVHLSAQKWLELKQDKIASQQDTVSKLEEKQILVNKLEQVAQNELRPIDMLEAANDIRLKSNLGIEYDSVIIEGENQITIEGKASSINALNQYVDSLRNSGFFELLAEPENITRAGKTTFKVSFEYNQTDTQEADT